MYGQAQPQGPFDQFINLMNHDEAKDLVRNINLFMKGFKQGSPDADTDSRAVQGFLQQMETAMTKHPLFANSSPQDQDAATEALEKYLMTKLHERTFRRGPDDAERDEALAVRCQALQFVRPEHLEIPSGVVGSYDNNGHLKKAVEELCKINKYKAPRDKLVCILNCCSMINAQLVQSTQAEGIGADDFTPVLIYVTIKAQTPYLASNLAYIERYRYHPKLTAEAQYYFIQLCGAATFIEMINASSLKVDKDEFIAHMLAAGAMTDEQLASLQSGTSTDLMAVKAAAAGDDGGGAQRSDTKLSIMRSTQAAVAAATAAGIQSGTGGSDRQQWQQGVLEMQSLPTDDTAALWPQAALGHSSTGWPYHEPQTNLDAAPLSSFTPPPPPPQQQGQQQILPLLPTLASLQELESQGAALLSQRDPAAAARQLVSRHPFCCSSLGSLCLGDVGQLLSAYKELVLRYAALTAALDEYRARQCEQQASNCAGTITAAETGPLPPLSDAITPPASTGGDAVLVLSPIPESTASQPSPPPAAMAAAVDVGVSNQRQQQRAFSASSSAAVQQPPFQTDHLSHVVDRAAGHPADCANAPVHLHSIASDSSTTSQHTARTLLPSTSGAAPAPKAKDSDGQQQHQAAPALEAHSSPSNHPSKDAGTDVTQQAGSSVDSLLNSLLTPSAPAEPVADHGTVMPFKPGQQQQDTAVDDSLFGLFQQSSFTGDAAAEGTPQSKSLAPSLLD